MNKVCASIGSMLVLLLAVSYVPVFSMDFSPIKNPKPNIIETEKHYVQLKKVKTLGEDLGNGAYLFKPSSLTVDNTTADVFVYDGLQAKIFKLDAQLEKVKTAFGGTGEGPGEFSGTGRGYRVFIRIGRDGKLYAYDLRRQKIMVFTQDGKYISDIKIPENTPYMPMIDSAGNIIHISVENKSVIGYVERECPLFTIPNQESNFNFLFSTPGIYASTLEYGQIEKNLIEPLLTLKSRILLFFSSSATMTFIENNKVSKEFRLWPREGLTLYKTAIEKNKNKKGITYIQLFGTPFADEDNDGVFYLACSSTYRGKLVNALYQFNDNGQLMNIFYQEVKEGSPWASFVARKDDRFYAIEDDQVAVYKAMK